MFVSGGAQVTLCECSASRMLAGWDLEDRILFTRSDGDIWQVSAAGGTPGQLVDVADGVAATPQMVPGGATVLFTMLSAEDVSWDNGQIVVQSLATEARTVLQPRGRNARCVSTGHVLNVADGSLLAIPFDADTFDTLGAPVRLVDHVRVPRRNTDFSDHADFCASNTGTLAYVTDARASETLVWVDRSGRDEPLGGTPQRYDYPRVSPDGTRLVFAADDGRNTDVYVRDLVRGTDIRLTVHDADDSRPIWTPDAARVVFASAREGTHNLFWRSADGTGEIERLATSNRLQRAGNWTPDGDVLVGVECCGDLPVNIWTLTFANPSVWEPLIESPFDDSRPMLSPDGRWMAYQSTESGVEEIYVQRFPELGMKQRISTGEGLSPPWPPDGRELFYQQGRTMMRVEITAGETLVVGDPQSLFTGPYVSNRFGRDRPYDVAPDGRFLMIRESDPATASRIEVIVNWFAELKGNASPGRAGGIQVVSRSKRPERGHRARIPMTARRWPDHPRMTRTHPRHPTPQRSKPSHVAVQWADRCVLNIMLRTGRRPEN